MSSLSRTGGRPVNPDTLKFDESVPTAGCLLWSLRVYHLSLSIFHHNDSLPPISTSYPRALPNNIVNVHTPWISDLISDLICE